MIGIALITEALLCLAILAISVMVGFDLLEPNMLAAAFYAAILMVFIHLSMKNCTKNKYWFLNIKE